MSLYYRNNSGEISRIAGLNGTSGELVPSDAYYQSGTFAVSPTLPNTYFRQDVAFDTSMPDTDYQVTLDTSAGISHMIFAITEKTVSGFSVIATNLDSSKQECTVNWQAFKLMTAEDNLAAYTQVAQNLANLAPTFSTETSYEVGDYVTYSGLFYKCTTAHSAGSWDSSDFTATTVRDSIKSEAVKSITGITVSQQEGTVTGCWLARFGNVVQLRLSLSGASMTTSSNTTLMLTFPSTVPKPVMDVWSCNDHYNAEVDETAALRFSTSGVMYVYTSLDHSPLTDATVNIGLTYLTDE